MKIYGMFVHMMVMKQFNKIKPLNEVVTQKVDKIIKLNDLYLTISII
jgi:hypothetical protein